MMNKNKKQKKLKFECFKYLSEIKCNQVYFYINLYYVKNKHLKITVIFEQQKNYRNI